LLCFVTGTETLVIENVRLVLVVNLLLFNMEAIFRNIAIICCFAANQWDNV